jgi:hypothetical protein
LPRACRLDPPAAPAAIEARLQEFPAAAACFKCSATSTRMGAFCVSPWVADRRLPAVSAVSRHANGGTRAERDGVPGQADRRGGKRKRERRRRLSWRRSRGAQAARHRSKHDASPAPAGPPGLHAAGRLGRRTGVRGAAPFPPRRSGRWPLQAATQIARGARAPLPFGDSLRRGVPGEGSPEGRGAAGGTAAKACPGGPGSTVP